VKATWLKDAKVDLDALTELSFTTHKSGEGTAAEDDVEQVKHSLHIDTCWSGCLECRQSNCFVRTSA